MMTYSQIIQQMYQLRQFGMKLGLDKMRSLASLLGNPEQELRFIHVAGTNGKGSTCALLESIYRSAGFRVGLFTSPHLVHFGERIQVDRHRLSEEETVTLFERIRPLFAHFSEDDPPTFFELTTAMALLHFREKGCELVIWETGLGGRLDATNVVTPIATVITNIGLDHQAWLGETHELIASEKAGILKPKVPAFTTVEHPGALQVIQEKARSLGAPLLQVRPSDLLSPPLDTLELPLAGPHQRTNAALACAVVQGLQNLLPVNDKALRLGLASAAWPGRFQILRQERRTILLDGAHNAEGAQALSQTLIERFPKRAVHLILGTLREKTWNEMLRTLLPHAHRVSLVPVESERGASPQELLEGCQHICPSLKVELSHSLRNALQDSENSPLVLIAGSLYLIGQALNELGVNPDAAVSERGLNEWRPPPRAQENPK